MLEIEELILKETPFLSIKDITQEEWVALDYELAVYDRATSPFVKLYKNCTKLFH